MTWWFVLACSTEEPVPERFNAEDQELVVFVQPDCTTDEAKAVRIPLLSNVGEITIGFAEITPGCGPVGTDHELFLEVDNKWQDAIDEAEVTAIPSVSADLDGDDQPEARDRATYLVPRDAADPGVFAITLRSLGNPDEVREDRWRVTLLTYPDEE